MKLSFEIARSKAAQLPNTGKDMLRAPMPVITKEMGEAMAFVRNFNEEFKRSYDASLTDQYNADFKATWGSANSELITGKYKMRARNRTLAKDTPHGKAVIRTYQNCTVGDEPFKLEMSFGDMEDDDSGNKVFKEAKDINRAIENGWLEFIRRKNFTVRKTWSFAESLRMVEASEIREGSCICRKYRGYPGNDFGFAVDFLEEDRLQETYMGYSDKFGKFGGGNPIRFSVEYDKVWGYPVAYWILTRHPGDVLNPSNYISRVSPNVWREQVPASDIVLFNNLRDRAEQDVGGPELDATTMPMWRIHQYEKSLTLSSIAQAMRPFWVEQDLPTGMEPQASDPASFIAPGTGGFNGPEGPLLPNNGGDPVQAQQRVPGPSNTMRPAAMQTFAPGLKIKESTGRFPIEAAHEFRQDNMRDIAVGSGVAYQHVSGDYQNLGFIAGLMCMNPFLRNVKVRQKNMIDGGIDDIFEDWLRSAIMIGYFEKEYGVNVPMSRLKDLVRAAHFKGEGTPFVNPLVQAQALILLNEAGHMTRQQVQDQLPTGMSFEKLCNEFKNENDELAQHGLNWNDVDVTRPTISKGEPGETVPSTSATEPGGAAQPPPKTKTANPVRGRLVVPMEQLLEMSRNGDNH